MSTHKSVAVVLVITTALTWSILFIAPFFRSTNGGTTVQTNSSFIRATSGVLPTVGLVGSLALCLLLLATRIRRKTVRASRYPTITRKPIATTNSAKSGGIEISNLCVTPAGQSDLSILNGVSFTVPSGSTAAVVGVNASGKSTLGRVLLGDPQYSVVGGSVKIGGEDILTASPDERANLHGLFVSWQAPTEIPGLTNFVLLHAVVNAKRKARGESEISVRDFHGFVKARLTEVAAESLMAFLDKPVNEGLSGGERKRVELLHLCVLRPEKLVVLDELDSGLDVDAVDLFVKVLLRLKEETPQLVLLVISHSTEFLRKLRVDKVVLLHEGLVRTQDEHPTRLLARIDAEGLVVYCVLCKKPNKYYYLLSMSTSEAEE